MTDEMNLKLSAGEKKIGGKYSIMILPSIPSIFFYYSIASVQ
jgi:hypothetical protein